MLIEKISKHALARVAQRNFHKDEISFILRFGQRIYNGGALFVFLGKHNLPTECLKEDKYAKLEGSTLVISGDGTCLITIYKNKKGLKKIKKKLKRFIPYQKAA